jgi:hypothetical protein
MKRTGVLPRGLNHTLAPGQEDSTVPAPADNNRRRGRNQSRPARWQSRHRRSHQLPSRLQQPSSYRPCRSSCPSCARRGLLRIRRGGLRRTRCGRRDHYSLRDHRRTRTSRGRACLRHRPASDHSRALPTVIVRWTDLRSTSAGICHPTAGASPAGWAACLGEAGTLGPTVAAAVEGSSTLGRDSAAGYGRRIVPEEGTAEEDIAEGDNLAKGQFVIRRIGR